LVVWQFIDSTIVELKEIVIRQYAAGLMMLLRLQVNTDQVEDSV
jgi:hypothetical protein